MNIWWKRFFLWTAEILVAGIGGYYFGSGWRTAFIAAFLAAATIAVVYGLRWLLARYRAHLRARARSRLLRRRLRRANIGIMPVVRLVATFIGIGVLCWYGGLWVILPVVFFSAFALALAALSPLYAIRSADAFERGEKWLVIFVRRRPNRLMQRIKGSGSNGKPLDFIGIIPRGKTFEGETTTGVGLTKGDPGYWKIVAVDGANAPTGVEIHRFLIVRLWMTYVNLFTDVSLVGVRKLYDIYVYTIEKIRYHKKTAGGPVGGNDDEYNITPPNPAEQSNHVRITAFQWAVTILGAETKDRLSWSMLVVANVRSINPWVTLHNHENWSQFLTTALVDSLVRGLRNLNIVDIMALASGATSDEANDKIIRPVYEIEDRLRNIIGLEFDKSADLHAPGYSGAVQVLFVEPRFKTEEDKQSFTRVWRAEQDAQAERTLGDAEAYRESTVIDAVAKVVKANEGAGELVQRMQALENAAKTGKSTLIFDTGSQTNNTDKLLALLVEQRERDLKGGTS